jgi:hypothetical protein
MRGLLGFLFLVGLVLAYWQWVLAAVIVVLVVKAAPVAWSEWQGERARLRALVARADQQTPVGDERRPTRHPLRISACIRGEPFGLAPRVI